MLVHFKMYISITGYEKLGVKWFHPFSSVCLVTRHGLAQSGSALGWPVVRGFLTL